METKQIAAMILSNVTQSKERIETLKEQFSDAVDQLIEMNVEPLLQISDEKQAFKVVEEILNAVVTNEMIDEAIKLPAVAEPFDGQVIAMVRPIVTGAIISFIDKNVLDKYAGEQWFDVLKRRAGEIKAAIGER